MPQVWRPRRAGHGQTIGRMRAASPGQGERYYVHLLLGQVRGALSFEDLRTVDGCLCASFKEACMLRGFLEDDRNLRAALAEGARSQMPLGVAAAAGADLAVWAAGGP